MKLKAVFLDKDGTLVPDVPYNVDIEKIILTDEVVEGLQMLQSNGFLLIVVSNQSGVARGYFTLEQLERANEAITEMLMKVGIYLDGIYYCPHHPEGTVSGYDSECDCRKPRPGLILKAARDLNVDVTTSWMIGDILNDVEAGNRAGCRTVLINNGNEIEWVPGSNRVPEYFARDLADAARYILAANKVPGDGKTLEREAEYIMHKA